MIRSIAKEEEIHDNQEAKHLSIESPNHWQVLYVQHFEKNIYQSYFHPTV